MEAHHGGAFILAGGTLSDIALMTSALQREAKIPLLMCVSADVKVTIKEAKATSNKKVQTSPCPHASPSAF